MNDVLRIARLKIALQRTFLGRAILIFTIMAIMIPKIIKKRAHLKYQASSRPWFKPAPQRVSSWSTHIDDQQVLTMTHGSLLLVVFPCFFVFELINTIVLPAAMTFLSQNPSSKQSWARQKSVPWILGYISFTAFAMI